MEQRRKDPLQLANEASEIINAQADEAQRELNKMAVELSGADITPKGWGEPAGDTVEAAAKREPERSGSA